MERSAIRDRAAVSGVEHVRGHKYCCRPGGGRDPYSAAEDV